MPNPQWPEHGAALPSYHPWHVWTSPEGAHHAGYLLDTVIGPDVVTRQPRVYEIVRCEPCLHIHAVPLPAEAALADYYRTTFYQEDKPDMVARYERDRRWWDLCVYRPLLTRCREWLPAFGRAPALLDVGAGPGIGLDVARELGYETWGIEPNRRLAGCLDERGHWVLAGVLDEATQSLIQEEYAQQFDVVVLYETLEHQPCPDDLLLRCYDLLRPRGLLVVAVPNDYNTLQQQARRELGLAPWWLAPPQHLQYYSPKRLQLALRRCGFRLVSMRSTYPLERFLLQGHNYIGNDTLGRICHEQRMAEELREVQAGTWAAREAMYQRNLAYGIGRELVYIGQR